MCDMDGYRYKEDSLPARKAGEKGAPDNNERVPDKEVRLQPPSSEE